MTSTSRCLLEGVHTSEKTEMLCQVTEESGREDAGKSPADEADGFAENRGTVDVPESWPEVWWTWPDVPSGELWLTWVESRDRGGWKGGEDHKPGEQVTQLKGLRTVILLEL
ncbi:hypothetical protein NDU88_002103 [Pleurodeles waltl]|uniref:Uncharacterized protein n=1 Tax=Pleurodeles waltl TaxID=8319 RepID=A0AAV7MNM6_PLEWA|nr:hypothetical protein NDU88_002103 [Pleurodeles waltl]